MRINAGFDAPAFEWTSTMESVSIRDGARDYTPGDRLRLPAGSRHSLGNGTGAVCYVKIGYLPPARAPR